MATNPLRVLRDLLTGDDLKARLPTAPAPAEAEQKSVLYTYTTENYDPSVGGNTLSRAMGGPAYLDWNSAVYACLALVCTAFQEAPLQVYRAARDGSPTPLPAHPFQKLLDDPHPSLSQPEVNFWVQYAKLVHGNAYLRKIRSGAATVVELWPISPTRMWPVTTKEDARAGVFVSFYRLDLGEGKTEDVPVEDVVHFRMGVDDRDHRLGLSPLRHLTREVSSDEEATKFADALLKNFAVPGLAVTIPPGPTITEEQARTIRTRLREEYNGEGRGQIAVVANGATLQPIGFSPQQLDLKAAHEFPESRIAAVFGVPAMVVGLGVGLQRSTFSNYKEAREALFEQTVVPLWRADAATYQKQLLRPDFGADASVRLRYDTNDVRALQEDMNAIYERLSVAVEKGWITKDEARGEVGFDPLPDGLGEAHPEPAPLPPGEGTAPSGQPGLPKPQMPKARTAQEVKAQALGAIPGLLDAVHDLAQPALQADLAANQQRQYERVTARLKRGG